MFFPLLAIAQVKGDYWWPGGSNTLGYAIDFNNSSIPHLQNLAYGYTSNNATICDQEGNLLFYSNGCAVMNRDHMVMPNGEGINAGEFLDLFWGGDCTGGYPGQQDVMILNDQGYEHGYYLFHKPNIYYRNKQDSFELHYTYIDMTLDGGTGDVVVKNQKYYDRQNLLYFYFTAIRNANKKDWWIVQPLKYDSLIAVFYVHDKKNK